MRPSRLLLLVFCVATASVAVARAEDSAPNVLPAFLAAPPSLPPAYDERTAWRLDLSEALKIAMQQNLGISVERKQLASARLGVEAATGSMYDPTVTAGVTHTSTDQLAGATQAGIPGIPDISGARTRSGRDDGRLSLNQRLPTGATLSLGLTAGGGDSPASTAIEPGTHSAGLSFSVTQPLLRGFSRDLAIPQYAILSAKIGSERERHQLELTAATLVRETETAYWNVVSTLYAYGVQVKAQKLAEDTVTLVRRQIAAGMAPGSDLTGAENTFAQRKVALLQQEAAVEQSWDALRVVLNLPRDQWTRPILPTDRPRLTPAEPTSPEAALATAMKHRPELVLLGLDGKAAELALRKAQNDALPQIDLGVTGGVTGQGDSYRGALKDLGQHTSRDWSVGVNLTWTPMSRASRAGTEIARIQREVTAVNTTQRVQDIWNEVRAAVRRQRTAALELTATLQSLTLASQTLEIENRKYLSGASSNLSVAQLQNGLASAELDELRALLENEAAQAALLLATGQLLEQRHVRLELGAEP